MKMVACLSCGKMIDLGARPRLFQEIVCKDCKQRFVVIEIDPPEICYPLPNYHDENEQYTLEGQ